MLITFGSKSVYVYTFLCSVDQCLEAAIKLGNVFSVFGSNMRPLLLSSLFMAPYP